MAGTDDEDRDATPAANEPPSEDAAPEPELVAEQIEGHDEGRMTLAGRRRTGGLMARVRGILGR